jgi:hypothetical protein
MSSHNADDLGFVQGVVCDRPSIIIATVFGLFTDALRDWVHDESVDLRCVRTQAEDFLRDEIDNIRREAAGERIAGLD